VAALIALRDANPYSELPELWRAGSDPSAWLGLKTADDARTTTPSTSTSGPGDTSATNAAATTSSSSSRGRVVELVLDGRGLSVLPAGTCSGLQHLSKLWLSNNGIRVMAPEIGGLRHLESL